MIIFQYLFYAFTAFCVIMAIWNLTHPGQETGPKVQKWIRRVIFRRKPQRIDIVGDYVDSVEELIHVGKGRLKTSDKANLVWVNQNTHNLYDKFDETELADLNNGRCPFCNSYRMWLYEKSPYGSAHDFTCRDCKGEWTIGSNLAHIRKRPDHRILGKLQEARAKRVPLTSTGF